MEILLRVGDRLVQGKLGQCGGFLSLLEFNQGSIVTVVVRSDGFGALTLGLRLGRLENIVGLNNISSRGSSSGVGSREILTGSEEDIESDGCDLGEKGVRGEDILEFAVGVERNDIALFVLVLDVDDSRGRQAVDVAELIIERK